MRSLLKSVLSDEILLTSAIYELVLIVDFVIEKTTNESRFANESRPFGKTSSTSDQLLGKINELCIQG